VGPRRLTAGRYVARMTSPHHAIAYVELTVADVAHAKQFYAAALGWEFNDYGPQYAGIRAADGATEMGGLAGGGEGGPGGSLVLMQSSDVDASARSVAAAGGILDGDVDAYPGGRRFTFTDPDGNRLGVFQPDA
jgi:uncharacterized protein